MKLPASSLVLVLMGLSSVSAALINPNYLLVGLPLVWTAIDYHLPIPSTPDGYSLFTALNIGMTTSVSLFSVVGVCNSVGMDSSLCTNSKTTSVASLISASYLFQTVPMPEYESWEEFVPARHLWLEKSKEFTEIAGTQFAHYKKVIVGKIQEKVEL